MAERRGEEGNGNPSQSSCLKNPTDRTWDCRVGHDLATKPQMEAKRRGCAGRGWALAGWPGWLLRWPVMDQMQKLRFICRLGSELPWETDSIQMHQGLICK